MSLILNTTTDPGSAVWTDGSALAPVVVVTDPGTGVAIPVTASATISMTTGGVGETNTLAIPTFAGQQMHLVLGVDGGGDRVITVASAFNLAGNTILTFADVNDYIFLTGIRDLAVLRWQVVANDGVALS